MPVIVGGMDRRPPQTAPPGRPGRPAGVLVLFLASFVPVLGVIVTVIALLFGLGAVLVTRMGARGPIDRTQAAAA